MDPFKYPHLTGQETLSGYRSWINFPSAGRISRCWAAFSSALQCSSAECVLFCVWNLAIYNYCFLWQVYRTVSGRYSYFGKLKLTAISFLNIAYESFQTNTHVLIILQYQFCHIKVWSTVSYAERTYIAYNKFWPTQHPRYIILKIFSICLRSAEVWIQAVQICCKIK